MTKHFAPIIVFIASIFGCLTAIKAQSVELHTVVTMNDGQEQVFYLTENDLFSFEGQETLVVSTQGSTLELNIDDIRKIEFVDVTGQEELQTGTPFFYPNPVRKTIIIGNIDHGQIVSIYSMEGRQVRQFLANANEQIDLSGLPAGIYILNLGTKFFKLMKL